jgi:hypothetical protein
MLPSTIELRYIPDSTQAPFAAWLDEFQQADRGSVRRSNDQTLESCAQHFAGWLKQNGYNHELLEAIPVEQTLALVRFFLRCVAAGNVIKVTSHSTGLAAKTLVGYATAASIWLSFHFQKRPPLYLAPSLGSKPRLHPFLAKTIAQRRTNWRELQKKKEPFTSPMFMVIHHDVICLSRDPTLLLDKLPAIFDWTQLDIFTGSRLGEYSQSKPRKGELFATVPNSPDVGIWANTPLAFIRADFTFYDAARHMLTQTDLLLLQCQTAEVHVCFYFDKSVLNFSVQKFRQTPNKFICAVKGSISILLCVHHLGIPVDHPIGVFGSTTAQD